MSESVLKSFELSSFEEKLILSPKKTETMSKLPYNLFGVSSINNLPIKNRFCYLCYSDKFFFDASGSIKQEFFDYYKNLAGSGVGMIFTGGYIANYKSYDFKTNYDDNENTKNNFKNLTQVVHSFGVKIFATIKTVFGRGDNKNKFVSMFNYSSSYCRGYYNSKYPCVRISDKKCNKIAKNVSKIADFANKCDFDGILIDGDLYGFIGEISSPEISRRKFGYYSEITDFSKKVLSLIMKKNLMTNIFYSISLKSFLNEIYGDDLEKITSIKNFKNNFSGSEILSYMEHLVKNGVDGFVFNIGTFETEFLSSPTEFEGENIFENLYLSISNYFKEKSIKNKFGSDVIFIYKNLSENYSSEILDSDNFLFDITNQIMSDSDYLFKLKNANLYRNCIKCGYCSSKIDSSSNSVFCAINPSFYANFNQNSYNFAENVVKSDNNYEKFAVVGGGLSGVNCAIFLAKSGKRVDIFESGEILLKNNRLREIFGYNKPLFSYNNFLCNEIETLKNKGLLSVFLGEKFSLKTCDYSKYLGIIVATGSSEKFSTIPGAVLKNVKNIFEVLDNKKLVLSKKNITIDAKSELSLSLAQYLLLNGKNVTIIITSVDFLFEMKNSKLTYYLYSLKKLNCNVFVMAKINKIESDFIEISINSRLTREDFAVTILNLKSKKKYKFDKRVKNIDSDILIYEPEVYSNNRLYYELVSSKYDGKLFMIGNALYPSDFSESIKTAFFVAKNI